MIIGLRRFVLIGLLIPTMCLLAADADDFPETDNDLEIKTLADAFMVKKVEKIIIIQYPNTSKKKPSKTTVVTDKQTLIDVGELLGKLYSVEDKLKRIGSDTPTTSVYVLHPGSKYLEVTIFGRSVCSPLGGFGLGPDEAEFTKVILGNK